MKETASANEVTSHLRIALMPEDVAQSAEFSNLSPPTQVNRYTFSLELLPLE